MYAKRVAHPTPLETPNPTPSIEQVTEAAERQRSHSTMTLLPRRFVPCIAVSLWVSATAEMQSAGAAAERKLQAFDFFDITVDLCDNRAEGDDAPVLGTCDLGRFPTCNDNEEICYNRKPSRDHFDPINHQHVYYIQYDRVLCYPNTWGGCSSCTPGRYCVSEQRCILEEFNYPCERWF